MLRDGILKRIVLVLVMLTIFLNLFSMRVFAAGSYGIGEHYLGQFTFTDSNIGAKRTYNSNRMRIKIVWKKGEWYPASGIDLEISLVINKKFFIVVLV